MADPFHVVAGGTRGVDKVRQRVQHDTLGHRERRDDPVYRSRKLLAMALHVSGRDALEATLELS